MPESVRDRFCGSHEYIFMFVKARKYYFSYKDALEPAVSAVFSGTSAYKTKEGKTGLKPQNHGGGAIPGPFPGSGFRLKRDVWKIPSGSSSEEHYAVYPENLIRPCIMCGCPEDGLVLDPFMGSGTTAVAAKKLGRKYSGCDINPSYVKMAERRIAEINPLFEGESFI